MILLHSINTYTQVPLFPSDKPFTYSTTSPKPIHESSTYLSSKKRTFELKHLFQM